MRTPFQKARCLSGRALSGFLWLSLTITGLSCASGSSIGVNAKEAAMDSRAEKLRIFFNTYRCPAPLHVEDYLRAADTYGIDYRLLPALSVRESTCGRHERDNNRWGWNSARTGFETVGSGIEFIARQLARGRSYRGKTLEQKLRAYNPIPIYAAEVMKLMREIEAD